MRTLLSSLLAVPLVLAADLGVELTMAGQLQASAADFTGRIKRVRIRERSDRRYVAVVVTENGPEQVVNPGRLFLDLTPIDGGPALTPRADLLTERVEDLRFDTALPSAEFLFGVVIGINTTKKEAEVPLDALLEGTEDGDWGPPIDLGNADEGDLIEVRARTETDPDGERRLELSLRARGDRDLAGTKAVIRGTWTDSREPYVKDLGLLGAIRRHTLVFDAEPGELDPGDFAYDLVGGWTFDDGAAQDVSRYTVDLDGTANGPRVQQVVLGENRRGDTRLVTRVSSPDDRPVVLEARVTDADGTSVIALADEAPVWTERQFATPLQFEGDPTGATYPVYLTGYAADGSPAGEGTVVYVTAERPTADDPFYDGTLFADDTAMVALLPQSEDSWQLVVHAVTDAPVASWELRFEEPFEGPVPESTVTDLQLDEVWRQYRQVARGVALSGEQRKIDTELMGEDGTVAARASGTEVEGAVVNGERHVDDVDVFIAELAANPGGARKRIRQRAIQRLRR